MQHPGNVSDCNLPEVLPLKGTMHMTNTVTLRQLTGMSDEPPALSKAAVVMVDCQNTYTRGVMELEGVQEALDVAAELLDRARTVGAPVIHIMHDAGVGTPFDVSAEIGQIIDRVAPRDDESIIVKNYPNSFVGTDLDKQIRGLGAEDVILAGFMTTCASTRRPGARSASGTDRPSSVARRQPARFRLEWMPHRSRLPAWPQSPIFSASWCQTSEHCATDEAASSTPTSAALN